MFVLLIRASLSFFFFFVVSFGSSFVSTFSFSCAAIASESLTTTTKITATTKLFVSSFHLLRDRPGHHHTRTIGHARAVVWKSKTTSLIATTTPTMSSVMRHRSRSRSSHNQQSKPSSSTALLSTSAAANKDNNDESSSPVSSIESTNKNIYFGSWEQPVYEKIEPFSLSSAKQKKNHVWVQVHAVSVNPVDAKAVIGDKLSYKWTRLRKWCHNLLVANTRVGFDFSGVVVSNDHDPNHRYPMGTKVYGTMPPLQGSFAEYIQVPIHQIAVAPQPLTLEEAAALPLVGLTAWQSLSPYIPFANKPKLLVIGGSGGTGHIALQVGKAMEVADLTTICSTRNIAFVKECGATNVIDYSKFDSSEPMIDELYDKYGPFDLILDCVTSGDPDDSKSEYPRLIRQYQQHRNYLYQRLGGEWHDWIKAGFCRFLPLSAHKLVWWSWKYWNAHEKLFWIKFPYSSNQLEELSKLAKAGKIKPILSKVYPTFSAASVQQAFDDTTSRRVQGKIIIQVRGADKDVYK